jgi:flagellar capping protein FliD
LLQLTGYFAGSSTSTVRSLSDLGVTFNDNTGQLTFDPSVVSGFSSTQLSDAFNFLGSSSSGFGAFASNFTQLSDPLSGEIQIQENGYDTADSELTNQIDDLNNQNSTQLATMTQQLAAADALCAQLESRQNTLSAEIESVDYVDYGQALNTSAGE